MLKRLQSIHDEYNKQYFFSTRVPHAFIKGRSFITNAQKHIGKRYLINIDLNDFFDSFHFGRVRGYFAKSREFNCSEEVATTIAQIVCYKGRLPQGAPTSPFITNLIFNIVDRHIIKIAKKYKLLYTRYADDLSFSTNDNSIKNKYSEFLSELEIELNRSGFEINHDKTRFTNNDSHQEVTGIVTNRIINVSRDYYKRVRAMSYNLYKTGEFLFNGKKGKIKQLEGCWAHIYNVRHFNSQNKASPYNLDNYDKNYREFIFYKRFFNNERPMIAAEGITDIMYLKAALKKYYKEYPGLIRKEGNRFHFNIDFLNRTSIIASLMGISKTGGDELLKIYNYYTERDGGLPNLYHYFLELTKTKPENPLILIHDNEQKKGKPLNNFLNSVGIEGINDKCHIVGNMYLMTLPLIESKKEIEIEDLLSDKTKSQIINGKTFVGKGGDNEKHYGKTVLARQVYSDYESHDLSLLKSVLDTIESIIKDYKENQLNIE